jgi:glycosyltransferase involved in cell wall biosynthesis
VLRAIGYLSFALSALLLGLPRVRGVDVIWAYQPPPSIALPAIAAKRIFRAPLVYEIQDMWPETLTASGVMGQGCLTAAIEAAMRRIYRRADVIAVISHAFKRLLVAKGVPPDVIEYVPNWGPDVPETERRVRVRPTGEPFHILYAGNLGVAQRLQPVIQALHRVQDRGLANVRLTLLGDGPAKGELQELVRKLGMTNVKFSARVPAGEVPTIASGADALLVHLADQPLFRATIPSKLITYLALGKPVLAGLAGEGAEIVTDGRCGAVFTPEDVDDACRAISALAELPASELAAMGEHARQVFEQQFSRPRLLRRYLEIFETLSTR